MRLRSQYLVCYDIGKNNSRSKVADLLLDFGLYHIQNSVFWGYLTKAEVNSIIVKSKDLLESADRLLIAPVNIHNKQTRYLGHRANSFIDWKEHTSI